MKKSLRFILILVFLMILLQGLGFAEPVSGKIQSIDKVSGKMVVLQDDCMPAEKCSVLFGTSDDTAFTGTAKNLRQLKKGQSVSVEIYQDEVTGRNMASKIETLAIAMASDPKRRNKK